MKRREFITLLGGAAVAWPLAVRAQQPTMPLVGFLSSRAPSESADLVAAFRQGLAEVRAGGLVIGAEALFTSHSEQLAALAARYGVPTIYKGREFAAAGGLMSYGSDIADSYRLAGIYTGRVLKGEKPGDLPVQLATKIELYINLKTAKALGLTVPLPVSGRADEVIE
jgi:putative tryptophan/tyrosine transport system substrate-binding protein